MDLDGTISTEVAMIHNHKAYYEESVTMGLPNGNDGKPVKGHSIRRLAGGFIPAEKVAKNIDGTSKDFMKFYMQPAVMNART